MAEDRPLSRCDELLVERIDRELVILDQRSGRAHAFDSRAAGVWSACTGDRTVAEIAELTAVDEPQVARLVERFAFEGLLVEAPATSVTRRAALRGAAGAGLAAALAVGGITTVGVPDAQASTSHPASIGGACTSNGGCLSGNCVSGTCQRGSGCPYCSCTNSDQCGAVNLNGVTYFGCQNGTCSCFGSGSSTSFPAQCCNGYTNGGPNGYTCN